MNTTQFATLVRYKTKTNSTTFSDAQILLLMNIFKDEIASKIVEVNNGMFLIPCTVDLVANQREYPIGDDVLNRIHKVEIKFATADARQPSTYIKDYEGSETESEIVKRYANSIGMFAHTIRRRALFLLSGTISSVSSGIRIWSHIFPADFATLAGAVGMEVDPSTTSFGFPRQFHELLARRVGIEFKNSQPKPVPLNRQELRYDNDLQTQLNAIASVDNSGEILSNLPSGADLWDNGYNL